MGRYIQLIISDGNRTLTAKEIKEKSGLQEDNLFRKNYLKPALTSRYRAMQYLDYSKRKGQVYYLTQKRLSV